MKQIRPWQMIGNWVLISLASSALITAWMERANYWNGFLSTSLLMLAASGILYALHRYARGGKPLAWMMLTAFVLRLGVGIWLMQALPVYGYPTEQQQSGYVFFDAYKRDSQAHNLAISDKPVLSAFTKRYATDQYGGYMALSMLVYRYLSADAQRPALMLILSALAGTATIALFWLAVKRFLPRRMGIIATWILVFFPQAVLMGASQMREPWIVLLMVAGFWSFLEWMADAHSRKTWVLAVSLLGLMLLSPGFIFLLIALLGGWWILDKRKKPIPLWAILALGAVVIAGMVLFAYGISRPEQAGNSPIQVILRWFRSAVAWDMQLSATGSGRLTYLFESVPAAFQFPFLLIYGILQPVLPAALLDDARWIWNLISSVLATGWYMMLPLLIYAVFAVRGEQDERLRSKLTWMVTLSWVWILISSARAGGDQWDNPRYRMVMLPWMAVICAWAWVWAKENSMRWLNRIFLCEGVFLLFFTQWYASRYLRIFGRMDLKLMLAVIAGLMALIIASGWWLDRRRSRKSDPLPEQRDQDIHKIE